MKIENIIASRIYSWVFDGPCKLNRGGKSGVAVNPLNDAAVTKRVVYCGQAATHQMYVNAALRHDANWTPSDATPRFEATEHPCIVRSTATGDLQVRILNPLDGKREYFVNGQPATQEQLATIEAYAPKRERNGVSIMFPYLHNLANVES
jgi:hypothetical protein